MRAKEWLLNKSGEFIQVDHDVAYYPEGRYFTDKFPINEILDQLTPISIRISSCKKLIKLHLLLTEQGISQIRYYRSLNEHKLKESQSDELFKLIPRKLRDAGYEYSENLSEPKRFAMCSYTSSSVRYEPEYSWYRLSEPAPSDLFDDVIVAEQVTLC